MKSKLVVLILVGLAIVHDAQADAPFATASIVKRDPKTATSAPITSARLDESDICLVVRDSSTADGDHTFKLVIYDGVGREVYQAVSTVTAKEKKWARIVCYGFDAQRDAPGTWWYVVELDEQPLVTKELRVTPVAQPGVG